MKLSGNSAPILVACWLHLATCFIFDGPGNAPVVNTTCGPMEGISELGVHSFRGIPFALPPVGKLRWQPPQKLSRARGTCWNGTLSAKKIGNFCFQYDSSGSEDCLYMNIFTPSLNPTARLPVMVWVHGGSYFSGSGNVDKYYADEKMAAETNVVYVNHNYRLHTFGFMALQILADVSPTNTSGNYAFMDTLLVLEWVRDNIRNFGGDPSKVTLYGHSAGATHVLGLMASPLSKGLFQRAWMASGSPRYDKLAKDAYNDNLVYLNKTGCSTVNCLLALTAQQATEAVPWVEFPNWNMYDQEDIPTKLDRFDGSIAIVDGHVVPEPPFDAFAHGFKMDVPFLIGSAGQEMDHSKPPDDMGTWNKPDYERFVHQRLLTFSPHVADMALKLYPVTTNTSARYQWASMVSDIRVNCGNNYLGLVASRTFTSPVYRYVNVNRPSKPFGDGSGSIYPFHTHDVYAFFGQLNSFLSPLSASDTAFEQNMKNEVLSFVRTGHPKTTAWTSFPGSTGLVSEVVKTVPEYHQPECEFFFANGLWPYSWRK